MNVEFHHGALRDSYELQANKQGYTLGKKQKKVEEIGDGIILAWVNDCLTDSEYHKALERFQKKIIVPNLKRIKE